MAPDESATRPQQRDRAEEILAARLRRPAEQPLRSAEPSPAVAGTSHALSSAQQRMWFLHELKPDTAAYMVTTAARLCGELDVRVLSAALAFLARRHEMLRSSFGSADGKPFRVVHDGCSPVLRTEDLRGAPAAEREVVVVRELDDQARVPFDLSVAPLFRTAVWRTGEAEYVVAITFHHIIVDGWSLGVFKRELAVAYAAFRAGVEPALPSLSRTFGEVIADDRTRAEGPAGRADLQYWTDKLAGLPMLELPMARPRPPVARFVGRSCEAHLDSALTGALERMARGEGASLYMTLAAAFATLLHRYSGQSEIVFGSPVANRPVPAVERMIGLFVNSVVLRLDLSGQPTFAELLSRVRATSLEAIRHQQVPFERIVEELAPERAPSHNPLFQAMFALQNADASPLALQDLGSTLLSPATNAARFDLECTVFQRADGLTVRIVVNSDIIDDAAAERFSSHYRTLLCAIAADPQLLLAELPLLGQEELSWSLAIERAAPPEGRALCLHERFEAMMRRTPGAPALRAGDVTLTFAQLHERAERVAATLREFGAGPGEVVAICTERDADLVVGTLGVLKAGAAFLPMDPADPADRAAFLLRDARVRLVLAHEHTIGRLAGAPARVIDLSCLPDHGRLTGPAATLRDLAYVIYTSGTTGQPKGVQVEHRNVMNTLQACQDYFGFDRSDRGLVLAKSTFDVFYYELFSAMLAGGCSTLVAHEELFDIERISVLLNGATCLQAVPGLMEHLLTALRDQGIDRCDRMRTVVTGGDVVPPGLLNTLANVFPSAQISVTYGPTEAAIFCTAYMVRRGVPSAGHPVGHPLPGTVVRVADENGAPLPVGVDGEIMIGGAGVARGYLNRPDETAEQFVEVGGERFYRSGDRGRRDAAGSIEFLGRSDQQVKIRGFRIELGEVLAVLAAAPGVSRAVVVPQGDTPSSRRLAAYVVPAGEAPDEAPGAELADTKIAQWRELFDDTYGGRLRVVAGDYDFTGWNSSYTGEPFSPEEMREWLDGTVAQILERVHPRPLGQRALRMLEIGCGTGLVLIALAEYCAQYVGTDFSARALSELRRTVARRGLTQVELHQADAIDLPPGEFDVVIINSVVQYLPNDAYLRQVLETALTRTRPGGFLFVGDVRSLPLLTPFHASVEAARAPGAAAGETLERARRRAQEEGELTVHPVFFTQVANAHDAVSRVEIEPRRGRAGNELTRYRYDAVLHRAASGQADPAGEPGWRDWGAEHWSAERLIRTLREQQPRQLAFRAVPHALLLPDLQTFASLQAQAGDATLALPVGQPVVPDELRSLAAAAGYRLAPSCLRGMADGTFDAVLWAAGDRPPNPGWPAPDSWPTALIGEPLREVSRRRLRAQIRDHLAARLPDYMQPASLTVLSQLPLTPNGKIDQHALPADPASSGADRRLPRTPAERLVCEVVESVLGHGDIAATDDFFSIGGTSLLAIQVAVLLRSRGAHLAPPQVFELRTIERIADRITNGAEADKAASEPASLSPAPGSNGTAVHASSWRVRERDGADLWDGTTDVLLTGATGMLGIHLLEAWLERARGHVTCLVRATDDDAALRRLAELYHWYFPHADTEVFRARVRAVAGDLTAPRLGLAVDAWSALARCDHIVHSAADVRHLAARDEMFAVNLGGTRRVLELADAEQASRVHYVSTIGVAGVLPPGVPDAVLSEDRLDVGQRPTEAYSASKLAAEHAVRGFAASGDAVVYRVGTVAPHSVSGRFQRNIDDHFLSRYLRSTIELGLACDWPGRSFALIPADLLARALLALGSESSAAGQTFHLQTPHTLSHGEVVRRLLAFGYSVRLVDPEQFGDLLAEYGGIRRYATAVGRLLPTVDRAPGRRVPLDATWTGGRLRRLGMTFPAPTTAWFSRFLEHGVEVGYFPPPPGMPGGGTATASAGAQR